MVDFADRLEVARERDEPVAKAATFFEGELVTEVLFDPNGWTRDQRDLRVQLLAALTRIPNWDADQESSDLEGQGAVVNGMIVSPAPSIRWTHFRCLSGVATACLPLKCAGRQGLCDVTVDGVPNKLWFVTDDADHVAFFRDAIDVERCDEAALERIAPSAFPNLAWVEGVWQGLRDFSRPYIAVRGEVVRHLSVLSDHGRDIFAGPRTEIASRFGSLGIAISPENGKTLSNAKCMVARTRLFRGERVQFVWHTKLLPHVDRIHVHEGTSGSGGKIIVGIMRDHLPLP
ncbi:MAG: hypothetical protein QM767_11470 [Anaeromyxobacter sp.]